MTGYECYNIVMMVLHNMFIGKSVEKLECKSRMSESQTEI